MSDYPEHDKLAEVEKESQAIGQFLDESEYVLCEYVQYDELENKELAPVSKSIQQILAEYFEIDLNKLEAEKRQILASLG